MPQRGKRRGKRRRKGKKREMGRKKGTREKDWEACSKRAMEKGKTPGTGG